MESAGSLHLGQATKETIHKGNIGSDPEVQNCQLVEDDVHNSQTIDSDADEKVECAMGIEDNNNDKELESATLTEDDITDDKLECANNNEDMATGDKLESTNEIEGNDADEKSKCTIKINDNNGVKETEHTVEAEYNNSDKKLEITSTTEPTKEDITSILSLRKDFSRKNNRKENIISSKISTRVVSDSTGFDKTKTTTKQSFSENNINHSTIGLVKKEESRNSPEIVIEPKIAERLPSGKITPQILRVMTPVNGTIPVGVRSAPKASQVRKKHTCLRKFKRYLFLVTYTIIVVGYAIGGAYLFSHLETKRDREHNVKIDKWKNDTAILLATELRQVKPHEEIWARKVFHYLEVYEKDLLKASALGYRRQDQKNRDQRWTWASSLFFSISLMTSSGYGAMTPRSKLGRVAAMFYSLFGIPLTFSWIMIIGYSLATVWLSFFQNICCYLCREKTTNNQPEIFSKANQNKLLALPKVRSNLVVPIEEQKLLAQTKVQYKNSARHRQKMFPEDLNEKLNRNDNSVSKEIDFLNKVDQMKIAEVEEIYYAIDNVVSIIYAFLLFVIYCVFASVLFSVYEKWLLTDVLYISFLMFLTLGPGCHELDDDEIEIKMKNNVFFTIHLCIGYCIFAMIFNLMLRMIFKKCKPEKIESPLVFDSCFREKY